MFELTTNWLQEAQTILSLNIYFIFLGCNETMG